MTERRARQRIEGADMRALTRCAAIMAVLLGGVAGPAAAARTDLRIGNGPEVESLDPQRAVTLPDSRILQSLYEGLLTVDPAGRPIPGAAESWSVAPDGLMWTFHLRADGRWSDGTPVTAEDFVFAWRRALTPATRSTFADLLFPIAGAAAIAHGERPAEELGVQARDPLTLEVRLERPKPNLADYLYHRATYPLHRASVERLGAAFARAGNLIGNGPYVLVEQVPQSHVALVRNPHFRDVGQVAAERVLYVVTDDVQTELKRYRTAELDATDGVPADRVDWAAQALPGQLRRSALPRTVFLAPNMAREPWRSNAKLRQALGLAIDRELLTREVLKEGAPAFSFVPEGLSGYVPAKPEPAGWPQARRDQEAQRLLREAGYGRDHPLTLQLLYPNGDSVRRAAVAIAAMWQQKLGVRTVLEGQELKVMMGRVQQKDYPDLALRFWQFLFPEKFLEILRSEEPRNGNGYASPAFDAAMDAADRATDQAGFNTALHEAEAIALDDAAVLPLYRDVSRHLVSPRLRGWEDNLRDAHPARFLSLAPD
jgi:oligopeptide transport system substrate-binding protein